MGVKRLAGLKLLSAVITETTRLCANLPAVLAREMPAEVYGYYDPSEVSPLESYHNPNPFV